MTLQNCTAAGCPQGSLPSLLTGAFGPPQPSRRALTSKCSHSKLPSCCSSDCTPTSGRVGFLDQDPGDFRVLGVDAPMDGPCGQAFTYPGPFDWSDLTQCPDFVKSKSSIGSLLWSLESF